MFNAVCFIFLISLNKNLWWNALPSIKYSYMSLLNNIHRLPKLILHPVFIYAGQHGSTSLARVTSSSCIWFCIKRREILMTYFASPIPISLMILANLYTFLREGTVSSQVSEPCGLFECLVQIFCVINQLHLKLILPKWMWVIIPPHPVVNSHSMVSAAL